MTRRKRILLLSIILSIVLTALFIVYCYYCVQPREYTRVEDYSKVWRLPERMIWYEGHVHEPLSTFPRDISDLNVIDFYCYYHSFFVGQPDIQIHLAVKYDEDDYDKEIQRLKNIRVLDNIKYTVSDLSDQAYVAVWNWFFCYEYAICHEEDHTIDYVLLQDVMSGNEKLDRSLLPNNYTGREMEIAEETGEILGYDSFSIYEYEYLQSME